MSRRKWGESFLKSGLPLEHLTAVTLRSMGWTIESSIDYSRSAAGDPPQWFELDLFASSPRSNRDTELGFLIECKYHDTSRFWMLLPWEDGGWKFDDAVLNCGPLQTLYRPHQETMLNLAPLSSVGVVVSEDGTKQDNALYTAVQQLVDAFVPYGLDRLWNYNFEVRGPHPLPWATAMIPMIVTNASLYRLKSDVQDLDVIRKASSPSDIADELEWTWCAHHGPMPWFSATVDLVQAAMEQTDPRVKRLPLGYQRMSEYSGRPHWMAIVNIRALATAATSLMDQFLALQTLRVKTLARRHQASDPHTDEDETAT